MQTLALVVFGACCLVPPAAFIARRRRFPQVSTRWVLACSIVAIYALILANAAFQEWYFDRRLQAFDLDGDGAFSPAEQTPEQEAAMLDVIDDTGRTFAPITGGVLAVLLTGAWTAVFFVGSAFVTRRTPR